MFGESRRVTVLIVVGALVALIVFGYAVFALFGERSTDERASIVTGTASNVYVDPSRYPGWDYEAAAAARDDETPPAPSGGTTKAAPRGGFIASLTGSGVPKDLPEGYGAGDLSPLFRKVRISSVRVATRAGTFGGPTADMVTLKEAIGGGDTAVNLTGMRLKTNSGTYLIPRAAKVYKTTGAALANVTLADGQSALLYGSKSPVGANFMGNACMGYLNDRYTFVPRLAGVCAKPTKSEIATFSGACQDYILKLGTCREGDPADSRIPSSDAACRSFVASISYEGCVERRQADAKFLTNVWNVWAGDLPLDPLHDRVLLLDQNGKLVDYRLY